MISCKDVDRKPIGGNTSVSFNKSTKNICELFYHKSLRSKHFEILKIDHLLVDFSMKYRLCNYNRGTDKSLAQPTSRCNLFDGENISFDASLVIYINSMYIPPIVIINRIYEHQNLLLL